MGRPRIRPILKTNCAYCGIEIIVTQKPNDHNYYCSKEHYWLGRVGREPPNKKWSTDAIIAEYKRIVELIGYLPSAKDIIEHSKIWISVYHKRFGTLDNVAKLSFPNMDVNADNGNWNLEDISDRDGSWLSGLCVGEGCFRITKTNPRRERSGGTARYNGTFSIQLRADDIAVLAEVRRILGLNNRLIIWHREKDRKRGINAGDGAKILVSNPVILFHRVIPLLEKFPMRGKKQADLIILKRGLNIILGKRTNGRRNAAYTEDEMRELDQLFLAAKEAKRYNRNLEDILKEYPAIFSG